ncbi:TPA: hypothetical protein U2I45_002022 [Providencia rettgeri]|uniref:hypothetical protein n=1 Tax=Providencia rettgeri TaxID=587 RepID=UPI0018E44DC9|nr:hypothetical protein [Providencia rettgeri]MBI6188663.1 hypothetical protein [Providencia rettgeri]UEK58374.1 hypothetical protein LL668_13785 [Providencia rettgeri]HEM6845390.1 hypothetical protein [Providencia rettgeri]HEP0307194.1 hypothetical protein [Providencia rettgeri]
MAKAPNKKAEVEQSNETPNEQQEKGIELIMMTRGGIDADVHPNEVERWTNEGWQTK